MALLPTNIATGNSSHIAYTNQVNKKTNAWVDVVADFGADPTGATDSTSAIQAAIDYVTGALPPASNFRYPLAGIFLPKGTYKITAPLVIRSVQGFQMSGAGSWLTSLKSTGAFDSILYIDGCAHGLFEGFILETTGLVNVIQKMVRMDWEPTTSSRSTHNVTFRDVHISNAAFKYGFAIGTTSGSLQVDTIRFHECYVSGNYELDSGNTTTYQAGWMFGSGTPANILAINVLDSECVGVRYGVHYNATHGSVVNLVHGISEAAIRVANNNGDIFLQNIRTESAQRMLYATGGTSIRNISLVNTQYNGEQIPGDGQWIINTGVGNFYMQNVECRNPSVTPVIQLDNQVGCNYYFVGVSQPTVITSAFGGTGTNTRLTAVDYVQSIGVTVGNRWSFWQLNNTTFRTGSGTSANRPGSGTVGAGAQWYDTTLAMPIWSNGGQWNDAMGNGV